MKLLTDRKRLCEEGKIQMCMAEYNGSWLPYKQPLDAVTYDWLLEELTYDDCIRKDEIIAYLIEKIKYLEKQAYKYSDLKDNIKCVMNYINQEEQQCI